MSTRSLTLILNENGQTICNMYRHSDGYPEGHGKALKRFLKGKKIVNGRPDSCDASTLFNGMGSLAAALVAHFQAQEQEIGLIMLVPHDERDMWADYIYTITGKYGEAPKVTHKETP